MSSERVTQPIVDAYMDNVLDPIWKLHGNEGEAYKIALAFLPRLESYSAQHPDDPAAEYADEHAVAPMSQPVRVGILGHIGADKSALTAAIAQTAKAREPAATLYDWSDVPEWVMWIATDDTGKCFGYANPPSAGFAVWGAPGAWWISPDRPDLAPNWRNSKEARPT